jgi:transposase InsO family protein
MEDVPKDMVIIPENHKKKEWPPKLIVLKDEKNRERILVPACQRVALTKTEHETMLHQDGRRVHYELSRKYYWPKMAEEIKSICKACAKCQNGKIRKQHLSAEFEQAQKEDIPLPRQAYGIDFYGHAHGEILVAIDLCTREVSLWFLQDRKQDKVAKSLLSGLIFQKGVPLVFRNDEAPEFVQGVVHSMNQYLGIKQITTGGYNPRSNAVVERFMQHLTACLTKCDDSQYKNIKDYLPAIAFAHNTAFNSAINCSPFEAGHGLRARTITEARASPRLQIITDRGKILQEPDSKWESSIFLKICKLAERLAEEAQSQSQWHKRMNAYNLNQSGRQISEEPFQTGTRVYFYRPPSQQEVLKTGRKVKHLMHYRGPATVTKLIPGRRRQYEIEFQGKTYKRDVGMLVPEQTISDIDVTTLDPTKSQQETTKPQLHTKGETLHEDKLIICRTDKTDTEWCLAEVSKIYTDEIELTYYTTPAPQAHNYANATKEQRQDNLKNTRFRKTWYLSSGKNIGKATVKAPFPKNPELRLWTGKIPVPEVNDLVLATNIILNPQGYMDNASIDVVSQLPLGHMTTLTIEDEESLKDQLLLTHALFTYTETTLCNCASCAKCFKETHK